MILFCDLIPSILTITCTYSTSVRFNPDVVINEEKFPVTDLPKERYTYDYTDSGGVVLQIRLSSDLNGYTYSCFFNATVRSREITLMAGMYAQFIIL